MSTGNGRGERPLADRQLDPLGLPQGWERRFVTDRQRAADFAELYRRGGFEVRVEAVQPEDLPEGCTDCRLVDLFGLATVYTRRTTDAP